MVLEGIIKSFVEQSRSILGDNLAGIYLHGSAAMGCFNALRSDVDLLVVVKRDMADELHFLYA